MSGFGHEWTNEQMVALLDALSDLGVDWQCHCYRLNDHETVAWEIHGVVRSLDTDGDWGWPLHEAAAMQERLASLNVEAYISRYKDGVALRLVRPRQERFLIRRRPVSERPTQ